MFDYLVYDSLSGSTWKGLAIDSDQVRVSINNGNGALDVFAEANDHWSRSTIQEKRLRAFNAASN